MGERSIIPMGHVRMMAAVQPFLSGSISKTVNMPESRDRRGSRGDLLRGLEAPPPHPHPYRLRPEHYEVFDCAMGERSISPMGHVRMMAAVQPFLSGSISKTVNMPESATVEDVEEIYFEGWKLGLKALAIYRDNCKVGQPLSAKKKPRRQAGSRPVPAAARARPSRMSTVRSAGACPRPGPPP